MNTTLAILAIIGGLLGILGTGGFFQMRDRWKKSRDEFGEKVKTDTLRDAKLDALHNRLDEIMRDIKDREGHCEMENVIKTNSVKIQRLEDEKVKTAERLTAIETTMEHVKGKVDSVDNKLDQVLSAVKK